MDLSLDRTAFLILGRFVACIAQAPDTPHLIGGKIVLSFRPLPNRPLPNMKDCPLV